MSDAPFDLRYASQAEHYALRERVAVLETEIKPALARIEAKLATPQQQTPAADHMALAVHRLADLGERFMTGPKQNDPWTARLVALAVIAACAVIGYRLVQGHW
jgi:hypothetical protein